jgi:putative colanic acid biosynthesis acetyltransferase WcaF
MESKESKTGPSSEEFRDKFGADTRDVVRWPYPKNWYPVRLLWIIIHATIWKLAWSRVPCLRRGVLRMFGAKVGKSSFRSSAWIEFPWLMEIGDHSHIGPRVRVYNLGGIKIGNNVVISQDVYLCGGTHDYTDPTYPLLRIPIRIEDYVWVAAGAFVHPGVTLKEGSLVGARAVVGKDVEAWDIVAGNPAKVVKKRVMRTKETKETPDA